MRFSWFAERDCRQPLACAGVQIERAWRLRQALLASPAVTIVT
jgi:hypothetical protein